jgi:hypothetical protein
MKWLCYTVEMRDIQYMAVTSSLDDKDEQAKCCSIVRCVIRTFDIVPLHLDASLISFSLTRFLPRRGLSICTSIHKNSFTSTFISRTALLAWRSQLVRRPS